MDVFVNNGDLVTSAIKFHGMNQPYMESAHNQTLVWILCYLSVHEPLMVVWDSHNFTVHSAGFPLSVELSQARPNNTELDIVGFSLTEHTGVVPITHTDYSLVWTDCFFSTGHYCFH